MKGHLPISEHWNVPDGNRNIEKHFQRLNLAPYTFETVFDGNPGWPAYKHDQPFKQDFDID